MKLGFTFVMEILADIAITLTRIVDWYNMRQNVCVVVLKNSPQIDETTIEVDH